MKKTGIIIIALMLSLITEVQTYAHDGHTDPVLKELNDYLMAIQLLRRDDPKAAAIFKTWQELRAESWNIRELTDEEGLSVDAEKVMDQISKTREKRKQLLQECRAYFAEKIQQERAIRFVIDESIASNWRAPDFEVQTGHAKVLLIEVQNQRDSKAHITMEGGASDAILFWDKAFTLKPHASRFTFAVLAPPEEKTSKNNLRIIDEQGKSATVRFRLKGIPQQEAPFKLQPGNSIYEVTLPGKNQTKEERKASFSEAISFTITDKETGKPLPARIEVQDGEGKNYWSPIQGPSYAVQINFEGGWRTPFWEYQPGPFFYIAGDAKLGVNPAGKSANIYHGFEYKPVHTKIPENGEVNVALERWINMPERGWYSGQTHIHTTDVGIPVQFSQYWPLVSQAEDLHVSAILTLKGEWTTHAIYANEYPMGKREAFSTNSHIITYGEEFRNNPFGHLAFIGLDQLIQPISTGALGELGGPDYPPNTYILDKALEQGATTIGAHFGNFPKGNTQIKTGWPSTGFEMPIDVALGKLQVAEIYGNGGSPDVWYDILNCGFKIPATAGPDWHIKDTPRVYVHLGDQPFTLENWRKELERGNSFITKGPMLFFKVNGKQPGNTLHVEDGPAQFQVDARALTPDGQKPVEIVYNGEVIHEATDLSTAITLDDSGWIAARTENAHTNPVYINFEGRPAGLAAPAEKFIKTIDRLSEWVENKALFDHEDQKEEVLEVIGKGRAVYSKIIERAKGLGRR